jgi:hypothetical protein
MQTFPIEQLRAGEHQLHAYCHLCDRWRVLDRDDMLSQWRGLAWTPSEVQCADCGEYGILKVRRSDARALGPAANTVWSLAG